MASLNTRVSWGQILQQKDPTVLPFLRFYREAGLVPEVGEARKPLARKDVPRGL
jgi:hypothetical protein